MIRQLTGKITYTGDNFVILDTGGVGYKVFVAGDTGLKLAGVEKPTILWTHLAVRETAMDLYGFLSKKDLDFFEQLISISGIGPKKAMGILSAASFETIRKAVVTGDASYLQKISGIGRKNAEKLVLELKDKFEKGEEDSGTLKEELEVIEALKTLGYSFREAKDAIDIIPKTAKSTNERVREALKALGK